MLARPREVDWAIRLLWITLGIGILASPFQWILSKGVEGALGILVGNLFSFGISAFLIGKITQGANWARITFLVLFFSGLAVTTAFAVFDASSHFHLPAIGWVVWALETLGQASALILLFCKPARFWFKGPPPKVIRLASEQR